MKPELEALLKLLEALSKETRPKRKRRVIVTRQASGSIAPPLEFQLLH
jgi:hypothetical protein